MVVSLMKWMPWPPLSWKEFEALIRVHCLKWPQDIEVDQNRPSSSSGGRCTKLTVEIRWKGSKGNGIMALSKKLKRNSTREEDLDQNGVVQFDEEFRNVCRFSVWNNKDEFSPWEVAFIVVNASDKVIIAGPAVLNLVEFASIEDKQDRELSVPLTPSSSVGCSPILSLTLCLREVKANQEPPRTYQRSLTMPLSFPSPPCFRMPATLEEDESPIKKKSLTKTKSLREYIPFSRRKSKRGHRVEAISDGKLSTGSENSEDNYSFYRYSLDYKDRELLEYNKESSDNVDQNSLGYGTLSTANLAGQLFDVRRSCDDEALMYYSNRKPEIDSLYIDNIPPETSERKLKLSPKLQELKRKLSVKSEKVIKGEPLLKKEYGERGGDDLDFIRWQLHSSDDLIRMGCTTESLMISEFGDDSFAVGSWKCVEVVSRDGSLKLKTQVFFATIDQMSEKAGGESACTALVVVLTNWLHSNHGQMPTQSEFDSLIREGSLQWRKLCENESYMTRFPDKHFDLETVIQAKVCPITAVSTTGFFHPEEVMEDKNMLEYLAETNSFDSVWDEISTNNADPLIYIISWNDHFFVLKIDTDAYYIIDTLGERLHEGCNRAYVLKFDKDTTIQRVVTQSSKKDSKSSSSPVREALCVEDETVVSLVCRGKEACKEYIKSFLAAIRIREWQADLKVGRKRSKSLHELLQIDIHYTEFLSTEINSSCSSPGETAARGAQG